MKVKVSGWITPDGYNGTQASGTAHHVELEVELDLSPAALFAPLAISIQEAGETLEETVRDGLHALARATSAKGDK